MRRQPSGPSVRSSTSGASLPVFALSIALLSGVVCAPAEASPAPRIAQTRESAERLKGTEAGRLMDEAETLYKAGKYSEALALMLRALDRAQREFSPDDPDLAWFFANVGALYRIAGDYVRSEPLLKRAVGIREKAHGPEHPLVAKALDSLGDLYRVRGEYARAEPLLRRALDILEKNASPDDVQIVYTLNNLALLYVVSGDYVRAEPLLRRSLALREKTAGPDHPDIATALNNLAEIDIKRGNFASAESLYLRSLAIRERAYGPEHPNVATALSNLGKLYVAQQQYGKAEPLYLRGLAIREKFLGPSHAAVATDLNNLGKLYIMTGEHQRAGELLNRALSIYEAALGPDKPEIGITLNNLAFNAMRDDRFAEAEQFYLRALSVFEGIYAPEHPNIGTLLNNLCWLQVKMGKIQEAIETQRRSSEVGERNIERMIVTGAEREKRQYIAMLSEQADSVVSLHTQHAPGDEAARRLALATILRRKGRPLDAIATNVETLRQRFDDRDQGLLDELAAKRSRLASIALQGQGAGRQKAEAGRLEEEVVALEREIGARGAERRAQSLPVTLEAVQAAIPEGWALVEYARYTPTNPSESAASERYASPRYVAYVLRREGAPAWVDLGDAEATDKAVQRARGLLGDPDSRGVKPAVRELDRLVFAPVRALLGDARNVLLAPDGALNLVPFGALADEAGRYLVSRYLFVYLTSGRDLLRLQQRVESRERPLIVANPRFGGASRPGGGSPRTGEDPAPAVRRRFIPLPATLSEARAIGVMLPGASMLTGKDATETALKGVHGPAILHVATHGFFRDGGGAPAGGAPEGSGQPDGAERRAKDTGAWEQIADPLLRAGLALAGANEPAPAGDDGILTAMEAAGLDLWGTKLVVLSACDTGVGEASNGDGVYGLRRALVIAGSGSQVISLWSVTDAETRDLMVAFYRALRAGRGPAEALRQAQLRLLGRGGTSHPFFWASFIASGEWRAIKRPGPRIR